MNKICNYLNVFLFVLLIISCSKDESCFELADKSLVTKGGYSNFILPFDISYGGVLTKGGTCGDEYDFEFSGTMLDSTTVVQKEVLQGVVYTLTQFRGELLCSTTSKFISTDADIVDGLVSAKVFHLKKEFCLNDSVVERIITMVPTGRERGEDQDFSYLYMPNFTGTILTSSLEGEMVDVWGVRCGRVYYGTLWDGTDKDLFAKVTFYTSGNNHEVGVLTKSQNDTIVNGGDIPECIVVSYRVMGLIPDPSEENIDYVVKKIGPGYRLNDGPEGGGTSAQAPKDELPGVVYHKLTVKSEFCDGMLFTTESNHTVNSEVTVKAQSSSNDSCLFYSWSQNGELHSHKLNFTVVMDSAKEFLATFHSAKSGACYELARIISDLDLSYKLDSLWNRTTKENVECGIALNAEGYYYALTHGEGITIPLDLVPGFKYNNVYHSHTRGCIIPSGGDLFAFFATLNKRQINDVNSFDFGIVGGEDIMIMNIDNEQRFVNYFTSLLAMNMGCKDAVKAFLNNKIIYPIRDKSVVGEGIYDYNAVLPELLPVLNNMGISVKTRVLNNGKLHWRSYSVDDGVMIMQDCIND